MENERYYNKSGRFINRPPIDSKSVEIALEQGRMTDKTTESILGKDLTDAGEIKRGKEFPSTSITNT